MAVIIKNDNCTIVRQFQHLSFMCATSKSRYYWDEFNKCCNQMVELVRNNQSCLVLEPVEEKTYLAFKQKEKPSILLCSNCDGGYSMEVLNMIYTASQKAEVDVYIMGKYGPQKLH